MTIEREPITKDEIMEAEMFSGETDEPGTEPEKSPALKLIEGLNDAVKIVQKAKCDTVSDASVIFNKNCRIYDYLDKQVAETLKETLEAPEPLVRERKINPDIVGPKVFDGDGNQLAVGYEVTNGQGKSGRIIGFADEGTETYVRVISEQSEPCEEYDAMWETAEIVRLFPKAEPSVETLAEDERVEREYNNDRELATILAALRLWQDREQFHSGGRVNALQETVTDNGLFEPLSYDEIDELCERLNFPPKAPENDTIIGGVIFADPVAWLREEAESVCCLDGVSSMRLISYRALNMDGPIACHVYDEEEDDQKGKDLTPDDLVATLRKLCELVDGGKLFVGGVRKAQDLTDAGNWDAEVVDAFWQIAYHDEVIYG